MIRTVLVAGGAGYIGSHMVKMLSREDCHVVTLDNLSEGHRDAVVAGAFIEGDLLRPADLSDAFRAHRIDLVMHFAAHCYVGESVQDPRKYYRNNVAGTLNLLNAMLEAEAEQLCNAGRYERTEARRDTRAGSYRRKLATQAGEVTVKVPKLRQQTFETAIIERYRRRESSVEEALIEMYLAGVSVRRVEDITEALWGTRVSPATVSPES